MTYHRESIVDERNAAMIHAHDGIWAYYVHTDNISQHDVLYVTFIGSSVSVNDIYCIQYSYHHA